MSYVVNGVPLDNPTLGWSFRGKSKPLSGFEVSFTGSSEAGRDGVSAGSPGDRGSNTMLLVVQAARAQREAIVALFASGGTIESPLEPGMQAPFRFLSSSVEGYGNSEQLVDVSVVVRVLEGAWQTKEILTFSAPLASASVVMPVFPGMTAAVQDAIVRVKGATGIQVSDSSGAWLRLPDVSPSEWVRFDSASGRCFVSTDDVWEGGVERSGLCDFGGPRGRFEITPRMAVGDPSTWGARVTVSTGTRLGGAIEIRGRARRLL